MRGRVAAVLASALSLAPLASAGGTAHAQTQTPPSLGTTSSLQQVDEGPIQWRRSYPLGATNHGILIRGVQLPPEGEDFFTWDPILERAPNRPWRRWAADTTLRVMLRVLHQYRSAHPGVQRVGIADISRPDGGPFGTRFGGLGHASHQNGLDVYIYYPRTDGHELPITSVSQIDRGLAAELVGRFVKAGAVFVFVGPHTGLHGKRGAVEPLIHHDNHMHVRFRPRAGSGGGGGAEG